MNKNESSSSIGLVWFILFWCLFGEPFTWNTRNLLTGLFHSPYLFIESWQGKREKKKLGIGVGKMRTFIPILNLPLIFQERRKKGKGGGLEDKRPSHGHRVSSQQTSPQDKWICPLPSKIVFKIQPSTFKNLSLISNSNKRTAWWLLFCFLLPNSSLRLHNKSV